MKHWTSLVAIALFTVGLAGITGCEQDTSLPPMENVEDAAESAPATPDAPATPETPATPDTDGGM